MNKSILIVLLSGLMTVVSMSSLATPPTESLYNRLGGYDAISAVVDDLGQRLVSNDQLGRFWAHRGDNGITRELQLIKDFITEKSGGPLYYTGREMKISHVGMRITNSDWEVFIDLLNETLDKFEVPSQERKAVFSFMESTKDGIVEL